MHYYKVKELYAILHDMVVHVLQLCLALLHDDVLREMKTHMVRACHVLQQPLQN